MKIWKEYNWNPDFFFQLQKKTKFVYLAKSTDSQKLW